MSNFSTDLILASYVIYNFLRIPQPCIKDLLIESGWIWAFFAICLQLQKNFFLPRTPLPARMSRTTFMWDGTVYWNLLCSLTGGGGGSQPKSSGCLQQRVAGQRQVLRIDCLPILNKPLPILPEITRTMIRDVQIETTTTHMHYPYPNFWNVQWAKEHLWEWS